MHHPPYAMGVLTSMGANNLGNDANFNNVSFLLDTTGADNSTVFTDASKYRHVVNAAGDAKIISNRGAFNGTDARVVVPTHASHRVGSGDFTVEAVGAFTNTSSVDNVAIVAIWKDAGNWSWFFGLNGLDKLVFYYSPDGINGVFTAVTTDAVPASGDVHVAVSRASGTLRMFINGVMSYEATHAVSLFPSTSPLTVGGVDYTATQLTGNIVHRSARLTKGVARYTATFTPPTPPY